MAHEIGARNSVVYQDAHAVASMGRSEASLQSNNILPNAEASPIRLGEQAGIAFDQAVNPEQGVPLNERKVGWIEWIVDGVKSVFSAIFDFIARRGSQPEHAALMDALEGRGAGADADAPPAEVAAQPLLEEIDVLEGGEVPALEAHVANEELDDDPPELQRNGCWGRVAKWLNPSTGMAMLNQGMAMAQGAAGAASRLMHNTLDYCMPTFLAPASASNVDAPEGAANEAPVPEDVVAPAPAPAPARAVAESQQLARAPSIVLTRVAKPESFVELDLGGGNEETALGALVAIQTRLSELLLDRQGDRFVFVQLRSHNKEEKIEENGSLTRLFDGKKSTEERAIILDSSRLLSEGVIQVTASTKAVQELGVPASVADRCDVIISCKGGKIKVDASSNGKIISSVLKGETPWGVSWLPSLIRNKIESALGRVEEAKNFIAQEIETGVKKMFAPPNQEIPAAPLPASSKAQRLLGLDRNPPGAEDWVDVGGSGRGNRTVLSGA